MEDPEQGSAGRRWTLLPKPIPLPPSKPIDEKWLTRRRVSVVCITFLTVLFLALWVPSCNAPPPPDPSSVTGAQFEAFSRLNDYRGTPLVPTRELMQKAQGWSEHMANEGHLSHSDPAAGVTPGWSTVGENVAVAGSIGGAQAALEASPLHAGNMMNREFTEAGVGVVERNGQYWITQNFAGR